MAPGATTTRAPTSIQARAAVPRTCGSAETCSSWIHRIRARISDLSKKPGTLRAKTMSQLREREFAARHPHALCRTWGSLTEMPMKGQQAEFAPRDLERVHVGFLIH